MFVAESFTIELECKVPVRIKQVVAEYTVQGTVVKQQLFLRSTAGPTRKTTANEITAPAGVSSHTVQVPLILDSTDDLSFVINGTLRSKYCKPLPASGKEADVSGALKVKWDPWIKDIKWAKMIITPLPGAGEGTSRLMVLVRSLEFIKNNVLPLTHQPD